MIDEENEPLGDLMERMRLFSVASFDRLDAMTADAKKGTQSIERINPDCTQGKHPACNEDAWDDITDQPARCECPCHEPS